MIYYWDTSALCPLIFHEKSSERLRQFVSKTKALPGYTSFFSFIELESAISRRLADRDITSSDLPALRLQVQLLESALTLLWPDSKLLQKARHLVLEFGLRPGDSMQLASALRVLEEHQSVSMVTFDLKLSQAAKASGINDIAI